MPDFTTSIVFAGVLVFVGGLIALGAQKARQMGAPFMVSTIASYIAGIALVGAIVLIITGITGLGERGEEQSPNVSALDRVLE